LYKTHLLFLARLRVRDSIVSVGPTLSKNEKVDQYIRKNTQKPLALRYWVAGGDNLLCGFSLGSMSSKDEPMVPESKVLEGKEGRDPSLKTVKNI